MAGCHEWNESSWDELDYLESTGVETSQLVSP